MVRIASIGIGSHEVFVLEPSVGILKEQGLDIAFFGADSVTLDEDLPALLKFLDVVAECDFIFIYVHGDVSFFRHWGNLRTIIDAHKIPAILTGCETDLIAQYHYMFRHGEEEFRKLTILETVGGDENHLTSLKLVMNIVGGTHLDVPDPIIPPSQGIYFPGRGALSLKDGLAHVGESGKIVILILFHNTFYLRHNTMAIDAIYEEVERAGGEAVPLFFHSYADDLTGSIGIGRIVDEYLLRDGKPVVDAVINTAGFSLSVTATPGCGEQKVEDDFFGRLGIPIIQAINLYGPAKKWKDSPFGLSPADIAMSIVGPEYDGQIDGVPYCGTEKTEHGDYKQFPLRDRIEALAEMAIRWGKLRHIPESEKKVAILIYMYPPRQDLAGGGYGLDTFASVCNMLQAMKDRGYTLDWMPADSRELVDRMLDGVTNDDNWKSEQQLRDAAVDYVTKEQYDIWFDQIAESMQARMIDAWGDTPGTIHTLDGKQLLPGIMNGNVFICFQPDRGKCTTEAVHDPWTAPPHQYLGFYRWLKNVWGADALIHVGTHGTLEWLPGKSAGLSDECDPDIILSRMPNINPYIIDNPGEGMQSKRRQYAITTTHLIPAMARSGGYDTINEVEAAVQSFLKARDQDQKDKLPIIMDKIISLCRELNLDSDMGFSADITTEEAEEKVDALYDYILEIKDALIKDGLHILGEVPEGQRMDETMYMLVRYPNGDVPSLREAVARAHGVEMEDLLKNPSGMQPDGRLNGELTEEIDGQMYDLITFCRESGFDRDVSVKHAKGLFPGAGEDLGQAIGFVCGFLADAVGRMWDEVDNVMTALDGGFVHPGPSGCPGRGRAQILPTGRNFYSIDPDSIPWHSSWEIGSKMAEQMVERYIDENGVYPKTVGMILWSTDTMKTGGDDVAYILKLMGLRPVWDGYGGRVKDLEVIPLEELGRPRIDVTVRISGLFRDTFPNISNLIDKGVQTVAALDEEDDSNYLAANVRKDTVEAIANGMPEDEAIRSATYRVFGDKPGEYGCGISDLIASGDWKTLEDLAESYVKHGCYVYGKGLEGQAQPDMFRLRLGRMDVTVKNHNTRAVDMLDMDDDFDNLGGFNAAVQAIRGKAPMSFMGDSSDMQNLKLRTAAEECRYVFRSKIDNPKWLEGLKKHGFAGAKELSKLFDYTMGWSATSNIIEKWMYDDLANRFVLDEETSEWIKDENPYAMMAMLARLQEAVERGLWDADPDMLEKLKDKYLEFEERIEEITDR